VRTLVILLVALIPLGTLASLYMIHQQGQLVRTLTLSLGPAVEANSEVLLEMTRARGTWFEGQSNGAAEATRAALEAHRSTVEVELDTLLAATRSPDLSPTDRAAYAVLTQRQRQAVEAWFAAALRTAPTDVDGARLGNRSIDAAWGDFHAASSGLDDRLLGQRSAGRAQSRAALTTLGFVVFGVASASICMLLLAAYRMRRSIVRPLERLSEVVRRRVSGDVSTFADTEHGAAEVRTLARDFNTLTRENARFVAQQGDELRTRQVVLEVARRVRSAEDVPDALDGVCASLGAGLGADRVLLYTFEEGLGVRERSQWHTDSLPDLPPLPASLAGHIPGVEAELRELGGGAVVLPDVFDPDWADDQRVLAFHRATGARSLVIVAVGTADQGLGLLAVLTVDQPRWWRQSEVHVTEQSAVMAARAIVQLRLAEMREEQVQRLTELDHQKTDFMATVSHELRTPLTSISGYLELLEDGDFGELTEGQVHALGVVRRNASRLRGLIEDLLVLNKIESTGLQAALDDVRVTDLVHCVVETMEPVAVASQVTLVAPPVPDGMVVKVDRAQVERALINLGSNAVKFTPSGGTVTIEAAAVEDQVRISISDTGIGIPEADLARLAERFFRAGNATAAAIPGTGLGLAIVRTIIEGHGGRLDVASVEGEGTTMTVTLPAA
jgi:signal transduction histidine kinase/HAMP domain-containing protein